MSTYESTWRLKFDPKSVTKGVKDVTENLDNAVKKGNALGDCFKRLKAIDLMAIDNSVQNIKDRLQGITDIAIKNESSLAEVSAITGVVGAELDKLNDRAKGLSRTYGEDLNENLDSFKTILSRLGPDLGKSDKAMGVLGESVNVLSKGMEGDIKGATNAITTSMLQFQVDLKNPVKAAEESRRMINVMAAGAKEGAAEIPQIGEALVQAGVSAKLANLTFEETNAAIQAMAGGGKYGSEAGVAIRNVITNMSASTALSKEAVTILNAYGVSTKKMGDSTVAWADRLRLLKPMQNDINALTAIFGRENAASAQILIRTADEQAELTKQITGTNVAYEQAAVIMNTKAEQEKRRNQRWNIFKLRIGNVTKEFQPYINMTASAISITANMKNAYDGLVIVLNGLKTVLGLDILMKRINSFATKRLTKDQVNLAITTNSLRFSMLWASLTTFGFAGAMQTLRASVNSVSIAIMKIPVVGWIIALVVALGALFAYFWNTSGKFRGFFYGIWEVVKLVFGGIWTVIKMHVNFIISIFQFLWQKIKDIFNWIVKVVGESWNWVANKFQWAWNFIKTKAEGIWNTLKNVFGNIKAFFQETFGAAWDVVSGIFDKIWNKIKGFLKFLEPMKKALGGFWDSIKGAFNKGNAKGQKAFADEKNAENFEKAKKEGRLVQDFDGNWVTPATKERHRKQREKNLINPTDSIGVDNYLPKDFSSTKDKSSKNEKSGNSKEDLGMNGEKGGNKTINMTINITNHFSAAKQQAGKVADEIASKINDRLRDGMVAID
ncbi:phage tail tape measure protein [Epilithonimonas hispanica]|uniref:Phage tail tape measure protein n=1 Tax=Epilithonimonas hispanica TaxID=358687 RepID=A0A3D9D0D8_9FLAO|nr:phage tail tape measure protein [Epilithonimonas hispanica]REC71377.1 phage tail tape measure protein [Epilithonimonas hispanica]